MHSQQLPFAVATCNEWSRLRSHVWDGRCHSPSWQCAGRLRILQQVLSVAQHPQHVLQRRQQGRSHSR